MKVCDISNYDYDQDITNPLSWLNAFKLNGIEAVIIGSQWMGKARWQLDQCNQMLMPVIATYAEPDVGTAIALASEAGCSIVAIVIEPGGVQDINVLRAGIDLIRANSMTPKLYGNKGDVLALTQGSSEFYDIELWFASYFDDQHIIYSVDFWPKLWGHQYTSTEVIAGKRRDLSEIFEEVLSMTDKETLDEIVKAVFGTKERMDFLISNGNDPVEKRLDTMEQLPTTPGTSLPPHTHNVTGQAQ
jgi:hypothetical protein